MQISMDKVTVDTDSIGNGSRKTNIINNILSFLVISGIILLPFSEEMHPTVLVKLFGVYNYEGAFYPFLIAVILYAVLIIYKRPVLPEGISFKLLIAFLIFIVISGIFNIDRILHNHGYETDGTARFVKSYMGVFFVSISVVIIYYVSRIKWGKNTFNIVRKAVLFSFVVPGLYAFLQILYLIGFKSLLIPINILSEPFHLFLMAKGMTIISGRLFSVAGEPSLFGTYLVFIFSWILSSFYTAINYRHKLLTGLLLIYIIVTIFFTYSRTAYFEIIIISFLFLFLAKFSKIKHIKETSNKIIILLAVLLLFGLIFAAAKKSNKIISVYSSLLPSKIFNKSQGSNITRIISQLAGFKIALAHPLFGVGMGQFGFSFPKYVPKWAVLEDPELRGEMNIGSSIAVGFPPARGLLSLIAAQTGFIGLFIWLGIWASLFYNVFRIYRKFDDTGDSYASLFGIVILSDIALVFLDWISNDSFRFYSYWFTLGFGLFYIYFGKKILTGRNDSQHVKLT